MSPYVHVHVQCAYLIYMYMYMYIKYTIVILVPSTLQVLHALYMYMYNFVQYTHVHVHVHVHYIFPSVLYTCTRTLISLLCSADECRDQITTLLTDLGCTQAEVSQAAIATCTCIMTIYTSLVACTVCMYIIPAYPFPFSACTYRVLLCILFYQKMSDC